MASSFLRNFRVLQSSTVRTSLLRLSNSYTIPDRSIQSSPINLLSPESFVNNRCELAPGFSVVNRFFSSNTASPSANQFSASNGDTATSARSMEGNSTNTKGEKSSEGGSQSTFPKGKPIRGGPISWISFVLLICTGAGLVYYYDKEKKRHIEGINKASNEVKQGPSVGKAAIGGPFNLIDHNGKSVTDKDFLGQWNLIYFGFTHCPDICPDELQKLASAIDKIKDKSGMEVVPIFISVDPERDTVEQIREYVKEFHPKLIGLTGTPDEVNKAARAYRVYYMKTEEEGSDYLVDHSIVMYLMDTNMEFVKFFGKNLDDIALADGVIQEMGKHKEGKANK